MTGTLPLQPVRPQLPPGQDPYLVYLSGLQSAESRRAMRRCLNRAAGLYLANAGRPAPLDVLADAPPELAGIGVSREWWTLRFTDTDLMRKLIMAEYDSPVTVNQHLTAIRRVLRTCRRLGLMDADAYMDAADLDPARGSRLPAGHTIHEDQMTALMLACLSDRDDRGEPTPRGLRDAAMFAILHSTGARRAEVAGIRIENYDPRTRRIRIIGKGNKQRFVYIHLESAPYVDRWLVCVGERTGPLIRPVDRWQNIYRRHLSPRAVGQRVEYCCQLAGVPATAVHDFRRDYATRFLDEAPGDLSTLKTSMGHASIVTTEGYDLRDETRIKEVVDRFRLIQPEDTHLQGGLDG
jgi:site-specific recombinase XerD